MKRFTLGLCAILALSLVGCGISKDKYTQLEREKQQLEDRMSRMMREKEELSKTVEDLEAENQRLASERQRLQSLEQENEMLRARMDSLKQSSSASTSKGSPGTLDAGTGRSWIGQTGWPVTRSKTYTKACFVTWATALMRLRSTVMSIRLGAAGVS